MKAASNPEDDSLPALQSWFSLRATCSGQGNCGGMNVHVDDLWEALGRTLPSVFSALLGSTATCSESIDGAFGGPHTF